MRNKLKTLVLFISFGILIITSCKKEKINNSTTNIPTAGFSSNLTIAQLKSVYFGGLLFISDTLIIYNDTIIKPVIQGIVTANDESGNMFKTLYIQDNTSGIKIILNRIGLFNTFKIGQKVLIKCSDLLLTDYGGITQLCYYNNSLVDRIPDSLISSHLYCDSLPKSINPQTKTIPQLFINDYCTLVKLKKVHFLEVGSSYSTTTATTNRTIIDSAGNMLTLRTSNLANFANNLLPTGEGDLVGIFSSFNGQGQLYIRDLNDLENWDSSITYPSNIINENFISSLGSFTQYSVLGAQVWFASSYAGTTYANISGYLAGSYNTNEDWLISPAVNFDNYTMEALSFNSAMKFGIPGDGSLKIFTSNNYSGTGDPNLASWNKITTANLSTGNYTWTNSGNIDLTSLTGINYIAFKYVCNTTNSATWEVTSIKLKAKAN